MVRSVLRTAVGAVPDPGKRDPSTAFIPVYKTLAKSGLLAPHWPTRYGGLGLTVAELGIVIEEMGDAGVPDTLHLLSIVVVGSLIQLAGTEEQKRLVGRALAAGDCFAAVLYTEPGAGTDLSAIETGAERIGGGYRLTGNKIYNLQTIHADYGLCLARSSEDVSPYQGLTLFLLPMKQHGINIESIPTISDEQFHKVSINGAFVPDELVIGGVGEAWALMLAALSFERTGLDYYVRGRRWLRAAIEARRESGVPFSDTETQAIGEFDAALKAGGILVWSVLSRLVEGDTDDVLSAASKWHSSELAQQIAWWAAETIGPWPASARKSRAAGILEAAFREAPGLTISAGASEAMLETIARGMLAQADAA